MSDKPAAAPSATRLMTPWGEAVTPDNAWREYPRPQLVRDLWQNLNGLWQFAIRPRTAPLPDAWDGELLVPFPVESTLSGVARSVTPADRLWYRREFQLPDAWRGMRVLLHFGAVDYEAAIWLNGAFVSAHAGGFDRFSLDITDYLGAAGNELIVGVTDPSSRGEQARGKQHLNPQGIWYTPVTGIWQTVWLEPLPLDNHIDELRVTPNLDGAFIDVEAMLGRPTTCMDLAVRLTLLDGDAVVASTLAAPDRRTRLLIPNPKSWSPDTPFLYGLRAELVSIDNPLSDANDQRELAAVRRRVPLRGVTEAERYTAATVHGATAADARDSVVSYFGMRSIVLGTHPQTQRPTLLLNGEPVFHLGPLDQGWWPDGLHTPPSDAAMVYEIEYLKAAGFNTLRKHIKVEPDRYYYHCDRLGLLVWQDMPSAFAPAQFVAPNDEGEALRKSAVMEQFELELRRMLNGLHGHPSIVMWVVYNEGWGQVDTKRLAAWVKALDESRVVNAISGWCDVDAGDLRDYHDYAEAPNAPPPETRRALVIGEYGGIGWPLDGHLWDPDTRNWGYQTYHSSDEVRAAYVKKNDAIIAMTRASGVCGAIYTQTSDVEGEVNGLLTYDRRVEKLPREWLAEQHRPLTGNSN